VCVCVCVCVFARAHACSLHHLSNISGVSSLESCASLSLCVSAKAAGDHNTQQKASVRRTVGLKAKPPSILAVTVHFICSCAVRFCHTIAS